MATATTRNKKKSKKKKHRNSNSDEHECTTNDHASNVRILELEAELAQEKLRAGKAVNENDKLSAQVQTLKRKLKKRDAEISKLKQEKNELIMTGGSPLSIRHRRVARKKPANYDTDDNDGDNTGMIDVDDNSDDDGGGKQPAAVTPHSSNNEAYI